MMNQIKIVKIKNMI